MNRGLRGELTSAEGITERIDQNGRIRETYPWGASLIIR